MPTFVFKNVATRAKRHAIARSMNAARDKIPEAYDGREWIEWECWDGGKCVWHYDEATKNTVAGRRFE